MSLSPFRGDARVTNANKREYVQLQAQRVINGSSPDALKALVQVTANTVLFYWHPCDVL